MIKADNLSKIFYSGIFKKCYTKAVDNVSFEIEKGQTFGLVGESGCGKSTLGRLLLRLIEPTAGKVFFNGMNLFDIRKKELQRLRPKMQIIFQNPESSLNPRMKVYDSIAEPLRIHKVIRSREEEKERISNLIEMINLNPEHLGRYPHELSGGEIQRVVMARILTMTPEFLVADEPTSSLDVSVQAQILALMKELQHTLGFGCLFISHDLNLVRHMSDRIAVMYLGKFVEVANTGEIFKGAVHPYTQALLSVTLSSNSVSEEQRMTVEGEVASQVNPSSGCKFYPRCPRAEEICLELEPSLQDMGNGHLAACHLSDPG